MFFKEKTKRKLTKTMSVIMGLTVLTTATACGGGNNDPVETTATSTEAPAAGSQDTGSEAPVSTERVTLEVALQANSFITDYDMGKNYFTDYIADYNDINLEFYMLPSDASEVRTKISLMAAAKDTLPEVIITDALTQETILDFGMNEIFIPFNDYLENPELTPNFQAVLPEDKEVMLESMTMADDNIYSLPRYEPETWNLTPYRMYMNKVWLDNLGLEVPTTIDELYDCLVAFRDNDPNGNGIQDELGIYGFYEGGYGVNIIASLINSFIPFNFFDLNGGLSLDANDKVIAPFAQPEYQDALRFLNKCYDEKLLAASLFTDDLNQFRATLNNEINIVGITSAGSHGGHWPDAANNENFIEMTIISPLTGPVGVCSTPYTPYIPSQIFFITSNCENPEAAIKFGDSFLNREISDIARYGEKGVDWTDDPAQLSETTNAYVEAGLYDSIRLATLSNVWSEPSAQFWHNFNPRYATLDMGNTMGNLVTKYNPDLPTSHLSAYNYEHYFSKRPDNVLPMLKYTIEETAENTDPITNITEYGKQTVAEFVTGARDIDNDWDKYLQELDNMGLQGWLERAQAAYERQAVK